jgi:hypothetical protein
MRWELYEVWSVDADGHEALIDTTKSLKEAQKIAKETLTDAIAEVIIYRDTDSGDLEKVEVVT